MDGDDQRGMHNRRRVAGGCRDGGRDKQGSLRDETWHGGGGGVQKTIAMTYPCCARVQMKLEPHEAKTDETKLHTWPFTTAYTVLTTTHKFIENLHRVRYTPGQAFPSNHIEGDM